MAGSDSYRTIKGPGEIEIRIKGSRFLGQALPCTNPEEADSLLAAVRKKYYDATHHCFAYRVGLGKEQKFRYSDAGEPSGTAGKPIYDRIEGNDLTDIIIVVTRYFGGTKLGTGGLTHAYSETAAEAIKKAGIIEQYLMEQLLLTVPYPDYNIVERLIHKHEGKILERGMKEQVPSLTVQMRISFISEFKAMAVDATSGRIKFE